MSTETVRLLFVSGLSILLGGFFGAYAAKSIYDTPASSQRNIPSKDKLTCPACAACPACPPPDCRDRALIPTSTQTRERTVLVPENEEEHDKKAGLPASAIKLASEKVRAEIGHCIDDASKTNAHGTLLLELTVTATGTEGFISEANIGKRSQGTTSNEELDRCLIESARKARFDWEDEDGEARVRIPVKLSR